MHLLRSCIVVVFLVAAVRADGTADVRGQRTGPVNSASDAQALTARVDAVLAARWAEAKVRPAAVADDGEFLRRVSLDLIGKIPTAAEARDFLDDPSTGKRLALVERLLDSPAYTSRATEIWRRLLLPEADTEDLARQVAGSFEAWLRKKVIEEAGYDRIVREILTAKLNNRNPDAAVDRLTPSPASYYLAKESKPENLAAGVARVFLGIRLECAQCHNHPFADWKREQFWSLAAFFAEVPSDAPENAFAVRRAPDAPPRRELTIPGTKKVVKASHLDGSTPAWRPRAETREILAEWVTAADNPYFARAVVNRVWARFFGVGLIEPVDNLEEDAASELSGLLDELAGQFRAHGYNLKFLIRILTATRAYNLSSVASASKGESTTPMFASMPVRGLSPGQLFDSLTRATGAEPGDARARFLELFASRAERQVDADTTIIQALTMMNGSYIDGATNPVTSQVLGAIVKAPFLDTPGRIETLFLATLTRRPSPDELALLVRFVEQRKTEDDQAKALADVFWAILNGPEFHLNH
jgi:Protein of unknown function (DUF1549)/Protein of unknown function (DUF1553)